MRTLLVICGLWMVSRLPAEEPRKDQPDSTIPRYQLISGRKLTFHTSGEMKYGEKSNLINQKLKGVWSVWILKQNKDGSSRVLILHEESSSQMREDKEPRTSKSATFNFADLFPDGRIIANPSILSQGGPRPLFPPLPKSADEWKSGWEYAEEQVKIVAKPKGSSRFDIIQTDEFSKIYLSTTRVEYTFDMNQGYITRSQSEISQGYGFKGKTITTNELKTNEAIDKDELKNLIEASDRYFKSVSDFEQITLQPGKQDPSQLKTAIEKSIVNQKQAIEAFRTPEIKQSLLESWKEHERLKTYYVEQAERITRFIHKPAYSVQAPDLDGKEVQLKDFKGKVVVLDFWYRGCGWCVKAMPQINQLVTDFANEPVAFLGMNTDQEIEDAKFVVEEMKLKYPTLRIDRSTPPEFGVRSFPTLVILDKKGIIRDFHVGYSPTLRQEIGKIIQKLLQE